jgi:hypothetical protein
MDSFGTVRRMEPEIELIFLCVRLLFCFQMILTGLCLYANYSKWCRPRGSISIVEKQMRNGKAAADESRLRIKITKINQCYHNNRQKRKYRWRCIFRTRIRFHIPTRSTKVFFVVVNDSFSTVHRKASIMGFLLAI